VPLALNGRVLARVTRLAAVAALATACAATEPASGPTLDISASGNPYFEGVRKQIRARWSYPCLTSPTTGACEYMNAQVAIEFGIRQDAGGGCGATRGALSAGPGRRDGEPAGSEHGHPGARAVQLRVGAEAVGGRPLDPRFE